MMNNDIEVRAGNEDWLTEMVGQVLRPDIGAVGAKLLYPNGKVQHGGVIVGLGGVAGHSHKYANEHDSGYFNRLRVAQELTACTAACLLIRREVFDSVGGFDGMSLPIAFNDVDLCLRMREAGWGIVYAPHATLVHHESYSAGRGEHAGGQFFARSARSPIEGPPGRCADAGSGLQPIADAGSRGFWHGFA